MKRFQKILGAAFIAATMAVGMVNSVLAEGSLETSVDKNSCANGESFRLTINAEADEGSTIPPQITVEFNANRLSFDNCSSEYGGGGGGLVTINDTDVTIDFTTLSGGDASIDVTAVLDEDSTDVQKSTVTVSVEGEDTAIGTDGGVESSTGVEEGTIDAGDGRVVQAVFAEEFMPVLFHKSTTSYQGQTVECAQFDMGDMNLLFTTDSMGNDGRFKIINAMDGSLSDFRMIQGIENRFIIVLTECEGEIPAGYTKAVLEWEGQALTAYMDVNVANGNAEAFNGVMPSDFFLVYALSSEGTKGWYQYDQKEGTYQRFLQTGAAVLDAGDGASLDESEDITSETFLDDFMSRQAQMICLLVFFGLCIILIIVVIVLAVKCSEYGSYDYYDPEDYYGEPEDEESYPRASSKNAVTAADMIQKSMADDDEVEDGDEEEDEESSEEAEVTETSEIDDAEDMPEMENPYEAMAKRDRMKSSRDSYEEEEDIEDDENYFDPRMSRKERKQYEKELRRQEKEAAKEEKWRLKEEKKAAKMRNRGYEEASPMDWSSFGEEMGDSTDDRRPVGRTKLPKYMEETEEEETVDIPQEAEDEEVMEVREDVQKLPPRKINPELSEARAAESAKALKEDELRKKQKRLFEQQQRLEEQRRIEEEQLAEAQKVEQQKFIVGTRPEDEDLDEDFQFEFLNLK